MQGLENIKVGDLVEVWRNGCAFCFIHQETVTAVTKTQFTTSPTGNRFLKRNGRMVGSDYNPWHAQPWASESEERMERQNALQRREKNVNYICQKRWDFVRQLSDEDLIAVAKIYRKYDKEAGK